MTAIAVLIITCPCALGLAVPSVQVAAAGAIFKRGALLKSGDALERLAQVDTFVFDKTGTLTVGVPTLINAPQVSEDDKALASAIAASSRHPLARALVREVGQTRVYDNVKEHAGLGLAVETRDGEIRLGSRVWCGVPDETIVNQERASELWLRGADGHLAVFLFRDRLRDDASACVEWLVGRGYNVELLSGDRIDTVEAVATTAGVQRWRGQQSPEDKIKVISQLQAEGHRVAMIGDGLNDAPALAAADVSLSPSTAADISQTAADVIYLHGNLSTLPFVIDTAKASLKRVKQNFGFALIYNVFAIPLAVVGFVSPLIAAIAMSCSSLVVTANALRPFKPGRAP